MVPIFLLFLFCCVWFQYFFYLSSVVYGSNISSISLLLCMVPIFLLSLFCVNCSNIPSISLLCVWFQYFFYFSSLCMFPIFLLFFFCVYGSNISSISLLCVTPVISRDLLFKYLNHLAR